MNQFAVDFDGVLADYRSQSQSNTSMNISSIGSSSPNYPILPQSHLNLLPANQYFTPPQQSTSRVNNSLLFSSMSGISSQPKIKPTCSTTLTTPTSTIPIQLNPISLTEKELQFEFLKNYFITNERQKLTDTSQQHCSCCRHKSQPTARTRKAQYEDKDYFNKSSGAHRILMDAIADVIEEFDLMSDAEVSQRTNLKHRRDSATTIIRTLGLNDTDVTRGLVQERLSSKIRTRRHEIKLKKISLETGKSVPELKKERRGLNRNKKIPPQPNTPREEHDDEEVEITQEEEEEEMEQEEEEMEQEEVPNYPPTGIKCGMSVATAYTKLEFATVISDGRVDDDGDINFKLSYYVLEDKARGILKKKKIRPAITDDKAVYIIKILQLKPSANDTWLILNYDEVKNEYARYKNFYKE